MRSNSFEEALRHYAAANPDLPQAEEPMPEAVEKAAPGAQQLVVSIERKGRGGKTATIVSGFALADEEVADIASTLKTKLGTGGSARGGEILVQGDRRGDVARLLRGMGHRVKGVK